MRTRRLSLVFALMFLAALLVVAPVQAGRTVAEFMAYTDFISDSPSERTTGIVGHSHNSVVERTHATDPRFEGLLTTDWECIALYDHPGIVEGNPWGPCKINWQVEVTDSDGWEGVGHLYPQSDFRVRVLKCAGQGYGQFTGMRVEWAISLDFYQEPYYITGRITERG